MVPTGPKPNADAATTPLLIFSLDGQRYGLPLADVQRCVQVVAITPLPEAPALVLGVVDFAGNVAPVIDMRRRFGHAPRPQRLSDQLIVATAGARTVALLVDASHGLIEVSPRHLVPPGAVSFGAGTIHGAVAGEDGLVLIHDLARLLSLDQAAALDRALDGASGLHVRASGGWEVQTTIGAG